MHNRSVKQLGVGDFQFTERAKQLIEEVINNNRLSYGPMHQKFERMFAQEHDVSFSLFTNSGTSALMISLAALKNRFGWDDNDEVIIPSVTFVATANIVLHCKMRPVFVDVDLVTFNINPELIEDAITPKTRCIIPVHLLGLSADMDPILKIAKRHNLKVIEDSCEAMFATCRGKKVGSMGDVGCFSTYVAHFLVTGVGGLVTTNDAELYIDMRSLMNHGRDSIYLTIDDDKNLNNKNLKEVVERRFKFVEVGYSFRCTELEAALGIAQLEEKEYILHSRIRNAKYLTAGLSDLQDYLQLPSVPAGFKHSFMLYGIVLKHGSKNELVNYLETHNIETRDLLPLVNQPIYKKLYGDDLEDRFPVAKNLNNQAFYIGCHHYFTDQDIDYIITAFKNYFQGKRKYLPQKFQAGYF